MDFSRLKALYIPEGRVKMVSVGGVVLWKEKTSSGVGDGSVLDTPVISIDGSILTITSYDSRTQKFVMPLSDAMKIQINAEKTTLDLSEVRFMPKGHLELSIYSIAEGYTDSLPSNTVHYYNSVEAEVEEITFTIDGTEYTALSNMTWAEWVESERNTLGIDIIFNAAQEGYFITEDGVNITDPFVLINKGAAYTTVFKEKEEQPENELQAPIIDLVDGILTILSFDERAKYHRIYVGNEQKMQTYSTSVDLSPFSFEPGSYAITVTSFAEVFNESPRSNMKIYVVEDVNAPTIRYFIVGDTAYAYEEGMSWERFIRTDYNGGEFVGKDGYVYYKDGKIVVDEDGNEIRLLSLITEPNYLLEEVPDEPEQPDNPDVPDVPDEPDIPVGGELTKPMITIIGSTLAINDESKLATTFDILVNGNVVSTISSYTFNLSTLGLDVGEYSISVIAKAENYTDSPASDGVQYVVAPAAEKVLTAPKIWLDDDGYTLNVEDESGLATEFEILSNSVVVDDDVEAEKSTTFTYEANESGGETYIITSNDYVVEDGTYIIGGNNNVS